MIRVQGVSSWNVIGHFYLSWNVIHGGLISRDSWLTIFIPRETWFIVSLFLVTREMVMLFAVDCEWGQLSQNLFKFALFCALNNQWWWQHDKHCYPMSYSRDSNVNMPTSALDLGLGCNHIGCFSSFPHLDITIMTGVVTDPPGRSFILISGSL